jgi:pre-rRNA-processing protein TSR3
MPTTLILRHRKENRKKCSLTPIEGLEGIEFFTYPKDLMQLPIVPGTIVLVMGAPPLPARESASPVLLIDGTWRLAEVMWEQLSQRYGSLFCPYSLPSCSTAYPRRQTDCEDPNEGLASIEALYLAHTLLGRRTEGLLESYHWRELFLERNRLLWEQIALERASGLK